MGENACAHQIVEKARCLIGRQHDFEAVFAGIAGAGDKPVTVGPAFERLELVDQGATGLGHQFGDFLPGVGALDGQHGQLGALMQVH